MDSRHWFKLVQSRIWSALQPLGYSKSVSNSFKRSVEDVLLFIQTQKSKYSTDEVLAITINLGVLSIPLQNHIGEGCLKPEIAVCQWRARIGDYLPGNDDKWWEIHSDDEAASAAEEIS